MPLINPPATGTGTPMGALGLLAANPAAVSTGYAWSYSAASKIFPAYTAAPVGTAFTGGLLDLLQAARLADLNTMRIALETLRVFTENLAQQHNAISLDLKAAGIINT